MTIKEKIFFGQNELARNRQEARTVLMHHETWHKLLYEEMPKNQGDFDIPNTNENQQMRYKGLAVVRTTDVFVDEVFVLPIYVG